MYKGANTFTVKDEFDMSNEQKTPAEIYREERKERIAKASKKSAKKALRAPNAANISRVISIILVVVIALGACWGILDYTGVIQRTVSVANAGGDRVSIAEYNYYYMQSFNQIYQTASYYESNYASSYGSGVGKQYTGFDYTKTPDAQEFPSSMQTEAMAVTALDGGTATWADYFRVAALNMAAQVNHFYNEAVKAGVTLSEDDNKEIEENLTTMRETATKYNYSLNRYLTIQCGDGVNEHLYKELMTHQQLAAAYYEKLQNDQSAAVSEEQIIAKYNEDTTVYDSIDVRLFSISYKDAAEATEATESDTTAKTTTLPTSEQALKTANEMLAKVTTSEAFNALAATYATEDAKSNYESEDGSFIRNATKSKLSGMTEEGKNWLFSTERKAGDKTVIKDETNSSIYVFLMVTPVHRNETLPVSVRHILFNYPSTTDDDGNTVKATAEEKAATRKKAEDMLASFLTNPSEAAFSTLATDNTEDTGSKETGGLYENFYPGEMVYSFDAWSFDPARKAGDTAVIESPYGAHIMYFVGTGTEASWHSTIKASLGETAFNSLIETTSAEINKAIKSTDWLVNRRADSLNRYIKTGIYASKTTA